MRTCMIIGLGILLAGGIAGCGPKGEETTAAPPSPSTPAMAVGLPIGTVKVGDQAVCAICSVKEGTNAKEEVKAVLDYKGKTYAFCSVDEKAQFISDPSKYAGSQ